MSPGADGAGGAAGFPPGRASHANGIAQRNGIKPWLSIYQSQSRIYDTEVPLLSASALSFRRPSGRDALIKGKLITVGICLFLRREAI